MMASAKEDDVATVKDSSSPPKYTSTGGVESPHPSAPPLPPPPYTEQPSYPVHATGQVIPALLPNGATLPGCQASPSGVDIHQYQTPINYPQQMFYQGASGGLVVAGQPGNTIVRQTAQLTTIPDDHCMLAWCACLCCFCPIGIIAVIKSNQVHTHLARGDVNSARIASAEAKKYAHRAICFGTTFFVLAVLFQVIVLSIVLTSK
ncbi:PREDICTED: proline-rich transmembrane protein 1-like isoform X2 [Acropora digitifera]|uniref:proline-rich transmembrane protein 1-like isoform X1 n=1 Tax=Acropora digitifera TaxID=70779 RepID=UPI00077A8C11|nr:PREDICTED: proline-rich transmembrane protein 1-like isoform X1 [Acropora digitifera]XP_015761667.1 PREDICTED: proline-rich transmembrane protein 1-like isoform X1 [Acropora digitifera]XP_015761668.1 PREDICTED: proline-rich transmembrane protein 1-like isoform X2 [Acropora digitifera]